MANDKGSSPDRAHDGENRLLRNLILLTLPWLSFQREMLAIVKKGMEDASNVRPVENLTSREFQALMMIFDPSGKLRNLLDRDLENKMAETYTKIFPKLASGSIQFIEAQETLLASMSDLLDKLRKSDKPNGSASGKAPDKTD